MGFTLKIKFGDSTLNNVLVPFGNSPKEYVTIDTTALKVSFTRTGKLFNLIYGGVGNLYLASFAFGSAYTSVSDAWIDTLGNSKDFYPTDTFKVIPFVPQGWYVEQMDSNGLTYLLSGYGYPGDTFIHISFTVKNSTSSSISGYAGFFADFDVGVPSKDTGYMFPSLRCILMKDVDSNFTGYIGMQMLNPLANISFIRNSRWFGVMSDSVKYEFLRGSLSFPADTVADWSAMVSSGPYYLNPGDNITINLQIFYTTNPVCPTISAVENKGEYKNAFRVMKGGLVMLKYGEIYSPNGRRLFKGRGFVNLGRGVYFLKAGGRVVKILIK